MLRYTSQHQQLDKSSEGLKKSDIRHSQTFSDIFRHFQKFSDHQLIRHSEKAFLISDQQFLRLSDCQAIRWSDHQTTSYSQNIRCPDYQTARLSDVRPSDSQLFSDHQVSRLPDCQTVRCQTIRPSVILRPPVILRPSGSQTAIMSDCQTSGKSILLYRRWLTYVAL